jgi:hypothetical protein
MTRASSESLINHASPSLVCFLPSSAAVTMMADPFAALCGDLQMSEWIRLGSLGSIHPESWAELWIRRTPALAAFRNLLRLSLDTNQKRCRARQRDEDDLPPLAYFSSLTWQNHCSCSHHECRCAKSTNHSFLWSQHVPEPVPFGASTAVLFDSPTNRLLQS